MKTQLIILLLILSATGYSLANLPAPNPNTNPIAADYESNVLNYSVNVPNGDCSGGYRKIDEFISKTKKGETAVLNIEYGGDTGGRKIVFNGDDYQIMGENGVETYLYFYKTTGFSPNSKIRLVRYILADEEYSFGKLSNSELSSSREDHIKYIPVCSMVSGQGISTYPR